MLNDDKLYAEYGSGRNRMCRSLREAFQRQDDVEDPDWDTPYSSGGIVIVSTTVACAVAAASFLVGYLVGL